jgi:hypothetical protein
MSLSYSSSVRWRRCDHSHCKGHGQPQLGSPNPFAQLQWDHLGEGINGDDRSAVRFHAFVLRLHVVDKERRSGLPLLSDSGRSMRHTEFFKSEMRSAYDTKCESGGRGYAKPKVKYCNRCDKTGNNIGEEAGMCHCVNHCARRALHWLLKRTCNA